MGNNIGDPNTGVALDYSGFADFTGDGLKEYLFGVTIGASAGNKLEIFKWNYNSLKMLADVPYHMMGVISNKKAGIAVWQRYIADTYFVDVLKWIGEKLVLDEEIYSRYYRVIERNSIQKGTSLAKQLSLPDAVKNFEQLSDTLEKKINSY